MSAELDSAPMLPILGLALGLPWSTMTFVLLVGVVPDQFVPSNQSVLVPPHHLSGLGLAQAASAG
jgi:hypothetical protein